MLLPPRCNAVAAQFARVVADVQSDVCMLLRQVVNAVRNELFPGRRCRSRDRRSPPFVA
jgi:hypothetical protein